MTESKKPATLPTAADLGGCSVPTPAVIVDWATVEKNVQFMAERATQFGVQLRPHIKTHKNLDVARLQMDAGAAGLTCAKVTEAQVFVEAGFPDVFLAYPVVGDYQISQLLDMAQRCRLSVAFDSVQGAQRLQQAADAAQVTLDVMMIVDSGGGRDGVGTAAEAQRLALALHEMRSLRFAGIMTHEGHAYKTGSTEGVRQTARSIGGTIVQVADHLRGLGIPVERVSTGATPTCWLEEPVPGINEWRPGTYVYNDVQEWVLGVPSDHCAVTVEATVVSHPQPQRYIIDAGAKTLSQAQHPHYGYGFIFGHEEARIVALTEEHGTMEAPADTFAVGERITILPIHVCTTVNMHDTLWRRGADGSYEQLVVHARGRIV